MTGATYIVEAHDCECDAATVKIRGEKTWSCLTSVNKGRRWEREEVIAHAKNLCALARVRTDLTPQLQATIVATLQAFIRQIEKLHHVRE